MKTLVSARGFWIASFVFGMVILGCRTGDLIARNEPAATDTLAPRPTFTRVPPTAPPTEKLPPAAIPPTNPPPRPSPTPRPPTPRPASPRAPTAAPPPTPDPQGDHYYKYRNVSCVPGNNTRIQGTVYDKGVPINGITVRVSYESGGAPVIADFVTGVDPSDYKHHDPALQGKYQLGIAEGQQLDGHWWVFIIDGAGNLLSAGAYIKTQDGPGCNVATVDFVH